MAVVGRRRQKEVRLRLRRGGGSDDSTRKLPRGVNFWRENRPDSGPRGSQIRYDSTNFQTKRMVVMKHSMMVVLNGNIHFEDIPIRVRGGIYAIYFT